MKGKTVILTGGNCGIGKETALGLAKLDARIILACRNLKTAQQTKGTIKMQEKIVDLPLIQLFLGFQSTLNYNKLQK
jgi:NAD(P)-dependent dehydrogenase (short-subunit alcohol dehydrogenase family)